MRRRASYEQRARTPLPTFDEGLDACRRILQRGARPAVLRLYDEIESKRHFDLEDCALIVLDEGDAPLVDATMRRRRRRVRSGRTSRVSARGRWLEQRNDVGALAPLWERGLVVDTIEVAGSWSILSTLHQSVTRRPSARWKACTSRRSTNRTPTFDGACLYFTFAAHSRRPRRLLSSSVGRGDDRSAGSRRSASVTTTAWGATARASSRAPGRPASVLLDDSRRLLDPDDIMNPGVLGLGGDAVVRALAIDVGSSSLRTAIVDDQGTSATSTNVPFASRTPNPG